MSILNDMLQNLRNPGSRPHTYLKDVVAGSLYRVSDIKSSSDISDIRTLIQTMRSLAKDSQVATALSYYATDATSPNSSGDIVWATNVSGSKADSAELVNALLKRWKVNSYARDHILELATVGNLYIPTTEMKRAPSDRYTSSRMYVGLDSNDIPDSDYDILPSHLIDAEDIVHIWFDYEPYGYLYCPKDSYGNRNDVDAALLPESSVIHFSLGGVIGKYAIQIKDAQGDDVEYDIQFANPLMTPAVQPTQTLNLLEDATVLSSLIKVVRFIAVDCRGAEEEEVMPTLMDIKNIIEQQLSFSTNSGDAQSYLNPQSPNNLIYLPKVNGSTPIEITDLNFKDDAEATDKLLQYYQDKKLSVLGIPKEALNFSSSEGLGGAGSVMSQRSALYANSLQRIETAYIAGWTDAINKYFEQRNLDQYVNTFELHMNPILTEMSTIQFDKRDSAINQAQAIVDLISNLGETDPGTVKDAIAEILTEALPKTSASVADWHVDLSNSEEDVMR